MLNFYVVSVSCEMVNDTDRSSTCRTKFRATPLERKIQKMKVQVIPKTWVSPINRLIISHQKLTLGIREQNKGTTKPSREQLKMNLITGKKQTKIF